MRTAQSAASDHCYSGVVFMHRGHSQCKVRYFLTECLKKVMKPQTCLVFAFTVFTFSSVHAAKWEPLNSEKNQTLEQHCSVVSVIAGVTMKARQIGVPMDALMDSSARPLDREILISAFEQPKMTDLTDRLSIENEFKSQWMLKCLKEHPSREQ